MNFVFRQTLFLTALISAVIVLFWIQTTNSHTANAATTDNLSGYAWSDNIGWISFNCTSDNTCARSNYGVRYDESTGNLSGYAWSDNIGWISFNLASGCPEAGCTTQPNLNLSTGAMTGWARALSHGGGWDGWIKLGGPWSNSVTFSGSAASGYSWGSDVVGWVNWSGVLRSNGKADLVSENLRTGTGGPFFEGSAINIVANVRNQGFAATGEFEDNFSYQWGDTIDPNGWNDLTPFIQKNPHSVGATSEDSINFIPQQTGTLQIQHCVDSRNVVDEGENEEPNCTVLTSGGGGGSGGPGDPGIEIGATPTARINANPEDVAYRGKSLISWEAENTSNCRVESEPTGGIPTGETWTGLTSSGRWSAELTQDIRFWLRCDGISTSVLVEVDTDPSLTASPRIVDAGDETLLTWTLNGQTDCSIVGGGLNMENIDTSGSESVVINANTTFTLTCPGGTDTATVEVNPINTET